jgi:hypothetical protein
MFKDEQKMFFPSELLALQEEVKMSALGLDDEL